MIKPSIGRVVLVYRGRVHIGGQWNSATVCAVHSDTYIGVAGFDRDGYPFREPSITLRQDDIAQDAIGLPVAISEPDEAFACWMPYQRKVAGA